MAGKKKSRSKPYEPARRSVRQVAMLSLHEDQPSTSQGVSDNLTVDNQSDVIVDTAIQAPSVSHVSVQDRPALSGPSMVQFQQLSNTVMELTELIKSLKQDSVVNNVSSGPVNISPPVQNVSQLQLPVSTGISLPSQIVSQAQMPVNSTQSIHSASTSTAPQLSRQNVNIEPLILDSNGGSSSLESQVQHSINEHLSSLVSPEQAAPPPGNYNAPDKPVDIRVTDKVRQQIWSNQYIELFTLLDPQTIEVQRGLELVGEEGEPVYLAPRKHSRVITSLGQWCTAFNIYLTVYCQKFPDQLPLMMTYTGL